MGRRKTWGVWMKEFGRRRETVFKERMSNEEERKGVRGKGRGREEEG